MKFSNMVAAVVVVYLMFAVAAQAQEVATAPASEAKPTASETTIPRLIKFSGTLLDGQRQALKGPVGMTFALYAQQTGGAALWMETQNVQPEANGNYTVLLGANSAKGVPAELFVSGEARWLGIQVGQQPEHERILLVSVPYALKAGDAETLGGLPASAFVTTATAGNAVNSAAGAATALTPAHTQSGTTKATSTPQPAAACTGVTSNGSAAVNSIALFTTACNVQSSLMSQATINGFPGINLAGNNAGLLLNGTGTHQVTVTGATSGRLGQDANGFFFASDTKNASVRFLTNNGTLNEGMRLTSAGKVGIGTTGPNHFLEVDDLANTGLRVQTSTAGGTVASFGGSGDFQIDAPGIFGGRFIVKENGNVGVGTTTPAAKLDVVGNLNLPTTTSATMGVLTLGGTPFLHNFGVNNTFVGASAGNTSLTGTGSSAFGSFALSADTTGTQNSAFGRDSLMANTTGNSNAAFGAFTLMTNTAGASNSAFGYAALNANTTGINNEAFGIDALLANTTGNGNAAFGAGALEKNTSGGTGTTVGANSAFGNFALNNNTTAGGNSAFGFSALTANSTGNNNVAVGSAALAKLTAGSNNIAIGVGAGGNLSGAESNNIYIGESGIAGESNTLRIGFIGAGGPTKAFIAGISGQTSASGVAVLVNGAGQLGTTTSSRRFKHEIADMGAESDLLMKLRPVAFYYKRELDETQTRQYGLVAEEVAQVAPQLVVFDEDGAPQTVRYHFVNAMLLNEVQKQRQLLEEQQKKNEDQNETIARQQAEIQDLAARLAKLEALLAAR